MKRIIALTLCLLMVVSCFVGCGKKEEDYDLVVWTHYEEGTPTYDVAVEKIAAFEEMTGAKLKVMHYGRDLGTLLPAALDSGERVDISCVGSTIGLAAQLDHTLDLTKYVEESDVLDRSYPICIDLIKEVSENKDEYHALPTISSFNAFWYNKAAFEAAGITENPETIEEFEAVCDALVAAGYHPIALDSAYATGYFGALVERMVGTEIGTELAKNGGFSENEKFVEACQKTIEWVEKGYFDPVAPAEWPASQNKIGLTGDVVMVFTGMWAPSEVEEMTGADLEWGSFKFPYDPEGTGTYGVPVSSTCNFITNTCPNPDLAWEYLYYMNTGEVNKALTDADVYLVDDRTQEALPEFVDTKEILETTTEACHYAGGLTENPDIKTVMGDVIIKLYSGEFKTGEEAVAAFDALFN